MKTLTPFIIFIIYTIIPLSSYAGIWGESVSFDDLHDQRTFTMSSYNPPDSSGGLTGYWPGFSISWDITYDFATDLWTYEYTLSADRKDVSHFIFELTEGANQDEFFNLTINDVSVDFGSTVEGPQIWDGSHGNSSPGWPEDAELYGIKFDEGGNPVTYSFSTYNDPVWGNFYAKSGRDNGQWVYVYNNALGMEGFESDNPLDFIVRPDGGDTPPVVPEPVSSVLFITGGAILAITRYLKK
jgi:hypothetical protein